MWIKSWKGAKRRFTFHPSILVIALGALFAGLIALSYNAISLDLNQSEQWSLTFHAKLPELAKVNTGQIPHRLGLEIDVLSTGHTGSQDIMAAQKQSWASHPYVRQFIATTELDFPSACMTWNPFPLPSCKNVSINGLPVGWKETPQTYRSKSWWCAQRRPILGLASVINKYSLDRNFPDWLLIVDDDTYLNMEFVVEHLGARDPEQPHGLVGSKFMHQVFYGGAGAIVSKGLLRLISKPLNCDSTSGIGDIDQNICEQIFDPETDMWAHDSIYFRNGMNLAQLGVSLIDNPQSCWHSDWISSRILFHWTRVNSEQLKCPKKFAKQCSYRTYTSIRVGDCNAVRHLICHKITSPEHMKQIHLQYHASIRPNDTSAL